MLRTVFIEQNDRHVDDSLLIYTFTKKKGKKIGVKLFPIERYYNVYIYILNLPHLMCADEQTIYLMLSERRPECPSLSRYTRPKEMIKTLFSVLYFPRDARRAIYISSYQNPLMIPLRTDGKNFPIENIKEVRISKQ